MPQEKPGQLHPSWQAIIGDELHKPYMLALRNFLKQARVGRMSAALSAA